MSRLLWLVLGGIATAIGAGVAAVMLDETESDTVTDVPEGDREFAEPEPESESPE